MPDESGTPARRRAPYPTIDDVAREAGVSKGTVSNVLNGRVRVSTVMRTRVERAIAGLGFHPAESARSLTARKRPVEFERGLDPSVPRLTTIGNLSVDFTAELDRLPVHEERRLANAIGKSIGGPAANVAAIAAAVGPPYPLAVSLITAIGIDQDSDWAAAELSRRRVDLIVAPERRTGRVNRALVLVEADGRRTIVNEPSRLGGVDVARFLNEVDPAGYTWCLHVEGYQLPAQARMMARAKARGFITSMQATGLPADWLSANREEILAGFDLVMLHRESLGQLGLGAGDAEAGIQELAALVQARSVRPKVVLVTLGRDGAAAVTPQRWSIRQGPAIRSSADSFLHGSTAHRSRSRSASRASQAACRSRSSVRRRSAPTRRCSIGSRAFLQSRRRRCRHGDARARPTKAGLSPPAV
jgi:ribokinase